MSARREVLDWLLEPAQPAVRRHAFLGLLDRKASDPEVRAALAALPKRGWARDLLALQAPGGFWESREDLYRPKYVATIWRFLVLSDLGLTAADSRMRRTCELFLTDYARPDGGLDSPGSDNSELCVTGNLTRALVRSGYGHDRRVRSAVDWILEHQFEDGGWHCFLRTAFGRGTVDAWEGLNAFTALPRSAWSARIHRCVEAGAEFFLEKEVFHQGRRPYRPWERAHYPVHYYYDFLVGLDMLTRLGYGDDRRLRPALELLEKKRRSDGTWALEAVHPDLGAGAGYRLPRRTTRFALEAVGRPSKWITLTALQIQKRVEEAGGR